ncbi:MAG: hypothetical protein ACRDLM_12280 [Gaiellaceae bacterium]
MAKIPVDGNVKVTFFPTCANIAAPSVTELTATGALDIECFLTPDGLDESVAEDTKDTTVFCSTSNYEEPGRTMPSLQLTYFRGDVPATDDVSYTTLKRNTRGFLAIREGSPHATAWTAADVCRVYTVMCGEQQPVKPAKNEDVKVQQKLYASGDYERDAVAAA